MSSIKTNPLLQCVCVCVYVSSHSFWTSSSLDAPAGATQEEGHTGFLIHLISAVRTLVFPARRIQPFLSLVDREVEFCVLSESYMVTSELPGRPVAIVIVNSKTLSASSLDIETFEPYTICSIVLSTCPLYTNSGCGKDRRILIGLHGDLLKQHSFGTTLRFTGTTVPADSRQ